MKKVLALVLAVMMMATVAFAATEIENPGAVGGNDPAHVLPGSKINIDAPGIKLEDDDLYYAGKDSGAIPDDVRVLKDVTSENYSITNVKYEDGKSLVESIKFNDGKSRVEIKLKDNFDLTTTKTLDVTFTLKGKKVGKGRKPEDLKIHVKRLINYNLNKTAIKIVDDDKVEIADGVDINNDDQYVYEVQKSDPVGTEQIVYKYGTLEFTTNDEDVEVEVRVYDGDKLYLYNELDADTDILKKYADTDADLSFLSFPGNPTFNANATVRFYKEEGTYIYANKDGVLSRITAANAGAAGQTAGNVKWDADEGCYILKTRTLGSYVFSDKALNVATSAAPETTNPDTGANDVVGVATALAAVALVSAAAVSLKK